MPTGYNSPSLEELSNIFSRELGMDVSFYRSPYAMAVGVNVYYEGRSFRAFIPDSDFYILSGQELINHILYIIQPYIDQLRQAYEQESRPSYYWSSNNIDTLTLREVTTSITYASTSTGWTTYAPSSAPYLTQEQIDYLLYGRSFKKEKELSPYQQWEKDNIK